MSHQFLNSLNLLDKKSGFLRQVSRRALSIAARLDKALEAAAASGDAVTQPDFTDLTSLFTSAGANPTPGDVVTQAVGTEAFGGKSFEDWLAGESGLPFDDTTTTVSDSGGSSGSYDASTNTFSNGATSTSESYPRLRFQSLGIIEDAPYYIRLEVDDDTNIVTVRLGGGGGDEIVKVADNVYEGVGFANGNDELQIHSDGRNGAFSIQIVSLKVAPLDSLWTGTATSLDRFNQSHPALTDNGGRGPNLIEGKSPTLSSGWVDNGDGSFTVNGSSFSDMEWLDLPLEPGSHYVLELEIYDYVSGSLGCFLGSSGGGDVNVQWSGIGTVEGDGAKVSDALQYTPQGPAQLLLRGNGAGGSFEGKIRSITLTKVLTAFDERGPELASVLAADWTPTGAGSSAASQSGSYVEVMGGAAVGQGATLDIECEIGKTYRADWAIELGTASVCDFSITETGNSSAITTTDSGQAYEYISSNESAVWEFVATATNHRIRVSPRGDGLTVSLTKLEVSETVYPNLVTNGTFDADSDWTKENGPTISSGVGTFNGGASERLRQDVVEANKWYHVLIYVSSYTSGTGGVQIGGKIVSDLEAVGWYSYYVRSDGTLFGIRGNGGVFSVDNVSVQEVPASIPRLNVLNTDGSTDKLEWDLPARRNLLTYTEDFSNGAWVETVVGSAVLPVLVGGLVSGPTSVQNAQRVQLSLDGSTGTGDISLFRQANATTGSLAFSIYLRSHDGSSSYTIQIVDPTGNAQNVTVTGAWQRFTVSGTASGSINYGIRLRGGQAPANSDFADILIAAPQLETGSTATDYQRVGAALHDDVSIVAAIKTSDTTGILFNDDGGAKYIGRMDGGASATNVSAGSPTIEVDGTALVSPDASDVQAAIPDGEWHVVAITGADLSAWTKIMLSGRNDTYDLAAQFAFLSIFPTNSETLALAEAAAAEKIQIVDPSYAL